ncbi:Uncharacterised protein [Mycobacteroides abscessus subsp. abscessus]|nr:Uncharacterised protein [Mycobacteroides abscessus subsp. abscessus]
MNASRALCVVRMVALTRASSPTIAVNCSFGLMRPIQRKTPSIGSL